jgi:NAD(P)H-flavin reductase
MTTTIQHISKPLRGYRNLPSTHRRGYRHRTTLATIRRIYGAPNHHRIRRSHDSPPNMAFHAALDWHEGEERVHKLTGVDRMVGDNPTSPFLTPRAAYMVQRYPLMALGTLDDQSRPWVTVWGGEPPFAQQVARSVLGIRTTVDTIHDPVVQALFKGETSGEVLKEEGAGRPVAGLSILLEERGRVKLAGNVVGGACSAHEPTSNDSSEDTKDTPTPTATSTATPTPTGAGEIQLVLKITQSLGNCPKYLNRKLITPAIPSPTLLESGAHLGPKSLSLISRADLFFIATSHAHEDMDCNHRGGPVGFIRTHSQSQSPNAPTEIIYPEYSGNNLYQTLGNLLTTPLAGLCIPDFESGDVLYVTGRAEVLIGASASSVIAKSKLAVRVTVTDSRLVSQGLPFRGANIEGDPQEGRSPYNPRVRYLVAEKASGASGEGMDGDGGPATTATLVKREKLTPTISRYRFSLTDPAVFGGPWRPGQHVALDFSGEMDLGYSHMRDDDPGSLNDDFLRTFTVSSAPGSLGVHGEEFEVTVRKVGSVTGWLDWQREGRGTEIGVRGFGGEFRFAMEQEGRRVGFVAGGVGVTPLLGQLGGEKGGKGLDLGRMKVLWSVGIRDVGLVTDTLRRFPELRDRVVVFLTGEENALDDDGKKQLVELQKMDVKFHRRRLLKEDLLAENGQVDDWYICTAPAMRAVVQSWLPEKSFVFENFNY